MDEATVISPSSTDRTADDNNTTTIYHIYHTGTDKKNPDCYSIHTIPDSLTTILSKKYTTEFPNDKALKKAASNKSTTPSSKGGLLPFLSKRSSNKTSSTKDLVTTPTVTSIPESSPPLSPESNYLTLKGQNKRRYIDNPSYDPRTTSAPYFIHHPKLAFHSPPYTLRTGGHKRAPVSCLLHDSWWWTEWRLQFSDALSEEGIIDGRGVVGELFSGKSKAKDGLKGYRVRNRRWWGESGKAWWREENEKRKSLSGSEEGKAITTTTSLNSTQQPEIQIEEVTLKWLSPFSTKPRCYGFQWRGYDFTWKGTKRVESRKVAKLFLRSAHLKLIVSIPDDSVSTLFEGEEGERVEKKNKDLVLARYACVFGERKAGRLEVLADVVAGFLERYVFSKQPVLVEESGDGDGTTGRVEQDEKTRRRFADLVVGTCFCMVQSESEKRRLVWEVLRTIGENAGG